MQQGIGGGSILKRRGLGQTSRRDAWWLTPAATFAVLSLFIVYATWAAFQNAHYWSGNYLSPFYSPEIWGQSPHSVLGPKPASWPGWLPFSPALLILPIPAFFRFTCYYYRGAYYKAFWADPPACAVSEPRKGYNSENAWPLKIQNVHRYWLIFALIFLSFLWHDVYKSFWFDGRLGVGVGSLVLLLNTTLLTLYSVSCHTFRYLLGGRLKLRSKHPVRSSCYDCVSGLNTRHMLWAWMSLFGVMFADLYVRLVSMGIWSDLRIL